MAAEPASGESTDEAELLAVIEQAGAEALASFGDATLYLEALLAGARHLEVTVVADGHGNVWTFGPHDATLRRRGDKVVIESAAAGLTAADVEAARGAAATLMARTGYRGVATVAFLHVPRRRPAPLPRGLPAAPTPSTPSPRRRPASTSCVCSCTSGKAAASTASRRTARCRHPSPAQRRGPRAGVRPRRAVARLRLGAGPGIRVDAAVAEGDVLAPGGPMLVAQMLAWGPSRDEARVRLRRARRDDGRDRRRQHEQGVPARRARPARGARSAGRQRLRRPHRRAGEIAVERDADLALLVAAIDAYETERGVDQARFFLRRRPWSPATAPEVGRTSSSSPRPPLPGACQPPRPDHVRRRARRSDGGDPTRAAGTVRAAAALGLAVGADRVGRAGRRAPRRGRRHTPPVRRDDQGIVRSPTPGVVVALPVAPATRWLPARRSRSSRA